MERLEEVFTRNRKEGRHTLIGYLTAGDPAAPDTVEMALAMEEAGVDVLELGVPFSDPLADGPVLMAAASRALEAGTTPEKVLAMGAAIRKRSRMPLVLLMYYNSILHYGAERFAGAAREAGIDALVVPDLPLEEQQELKEALEESHMALIPLVSMDSGDRLPRILRNARGFVYCVSAGGVTGIREEFSRESREYLSRVRELTDLPLAVGFGISRRQDVEFFSPHCDGVIVGTAIMKEATRPGGGQMAVTDYIRRELR